VDGPALEDVHRQAARVGGEAAAELLHVEPAHRPALLVHGDLGIGPASDALQFGHAGEVEQLRDVVDSHVEERAAPGGGRVDELFGGVAVDEGPSAPPEAVGAHVVEVAQASGPDDPAGGLRLVVVEQPELDVQAATCAAPRRVHRQRVGIGAGHRLLAVDVFAGLHSRDRHRRVQVVVQADVDCGDVLFPQQLADVGEAACDLVLVADQIEPRLVDVTDRRDLGMRVVRVAADMMLADDAAADDRHRNLAGHIALPISCRLS
jgi:hypothetical protein